MSKQYSDRPNIVLIHGHDMGRYLGSYGYPVHTPHLDRLMHEGVRFDNYFCPAPQCSPSRASMITGLYPNNSGMMGLAHLDWHLNDAHDALPHQLKAQGYQTLLVGEQHEASDGEILGYETCVGTKWPQLARIVAPAFAEQLSNLKHDRPFFASIGFFEAHRPFDHPGYQDDPPDDIPVLPYLPDTEEVRQDLGRLHGRVRAVDEGVGIILDALSAAGQEQNTLVIFTTDHGLAFPRAKGTLYDSGLEVAFIVRWPDVVKPGEARQELLCNIDLVPTLLDILNIEPRKELDGESFLPLLHGQEQAVRDHFVCQMTWHDRYIPMRGIRTTEWKYIRHFNNEPNLYLPADVEESISGQVFRSHEQGDHRPAEELYDLKADPHELNNLALDDALEDTKKALWQRVEAWMLKTHDPLLNETSRSRD